MASEVSSDSYFDDDSDDYNLSPEPNVRSSPDSSDCQKKSTEPRQGMVTTPICSPYRYPFSIEIVFVHGPNFKLTVDEEDVLRSWRDGQVLVLHHDYDREQLLRQPLVQKVQEISRAMLNRLQDTIFKQSSGKERIAFMADDWGGCIVKWALIFSNNDERYRGIAQDTFILAFFASPHRAGNDEHWSKLASGMIRAWVGDLGLETYPTSVKEGAKMLSDTSRSFHPYALGYHIMNVYQKNDSAEDAPIIIDRWAITLETAREICIGRATSHSKLSHFQEDSVWEKFWTHLTEPSFNPAGKLLPQTYIELCSGFLRPGSLAIILDDSEFAQMQNQTPHKYLLQHLSGHPKVEAWKCDMWPSIMVLHSMRNLIIGDLSILLERENDRSWSSRAKMLALSFAPNPQGQDGTAVSRVILSLVQQICDGGYDESIVADIFNHRASPMWMERQLWVLFRTLLSAWTARYIIFVISSFENCASRDRWILDELIMFGINNERRFKVLLGTKEPLNHDDDSDSQVEEYPVNLDEWAKETEEPVICVQSLLNSFLEKKPTFNVLREKLCRKLENSKLDDGPGVRIMLRSLEHADSLSTKTALRKEVDSFQTLDTHNVITTILAKTPRAKQDWVQGVLTLVINARVPLTISGLSVALAIKEEGMLLSDTWKVYIPHDLLGDLDRFLPALVTVHDDRVRLADPDISEFLANPACKNRLTPSCQSDWILCRKCLFYLSLKDTIEASDSLVNNDQEVGCSLSLPKKDHWLGFLHYTVRYWPVHYRAAAKSEDIDHRMVLEFLKRPDAVRAWSQLYWYMEEPFFKQKGGLVSLAPLHIAIHFGFTEIVKMLCIDEFHGLLTDDDDFTIAVMTAARHGHAEILEHLLKMCRASTAIINAVLSDTANVGAEGVLMTLLRYSGTQLPYGKVTSLVHITAENGWSESMEFLLGQPAGQRYNVQIGGQQILTPLHHAANQGHSKIISHLLSQKSYSYPKCDPDNSLPMPLHLAAVRGYPNAVPLLVKFEDSINSLGPKSQTALHLAAKNGFINIVEILVQARCDVKCKDEAGLTHFTWYAVMSLPKRQRN